MGSKDDIADVMIALVSQVDDMTTDLIDLLLSYDTAGVLPSKDEIESIEPDASADVLAACREVWRAANPLVAAALTAIETPEPTTNVSSPPTSTSPRPTAGRRKKSRPA